ncbi:MAG TPA: VOC family protein [Spirochaetota bacterium]|nr:VOC family protein [Spirochaetota bacterium]HPV40182.1 VOC family protein [Spirochaetota bacterium]
MITRIDHVAIAVKDYDKAYRFFSTLLGAIPGSSSRDASMNYLWQNLYLGDLSRLELLTATGPKSFLDGFLAKKDGGVHHITMQTPDLKKAAAELERNGIPYFGYHEYGSVWKELFIHPKDAFGVLIQIAEFTADDWLPLSVRMTGSKKFRVEPKNGGCSLTLPHPGGGTVTIDLNAGEMEQLRKELVDKSPVS